MTFQNTSKVALIGGAGAIGAALCDALKQRHQVLMLTRSRSRVQLEQDNEHVIWRHCDPFHLDQVQSAFAGADTVVYLARTQEANSRLTPSQFRTLSLFIADNIARAAAHCGVKQIIFLSHLGSFGKEGRYVTQIRKVEDSLAAYGAGLTVLRAGPIIGPGSSLTQALINLVRRFPIMTLPSWTKNHVRPIAMCDLAQVTAQCAGDQAYYGKRIDLSGPAQLSFKRMIQSISKALGKNSFLIDLPGPWTGLSKFWLRHAAGFNRDMAGLLTDSLAISQKASLTPDFSWINEKGDDLQFAINKSIVTPARPNTSRHLSPVETKTQGEVLSSARRLSRPPGYNAIESGRAFIRWLPDFGWPWLNCEIISENRCRFYLRPFNLLLIELSFDRRHSTKDLCFFVIEKGFLVRPQEQGLGRLEIREILKGSELIVSIHHYQPRLPYLLYKLTQERLYQFMITQFNHYLQRLHEVSSVGMSQVKRAHHL